MKSFDERPPLFSRSPDTISLSDAILTVVGLIAIVALGMRFQAYAQKRGWISISEREEWDQVGSP